MCGRYTYFEAQRKAAERLKRPVPDLFANYNIKPTNDVLIVRKDDAAIAGWGLVHRHAAEVKFAPFNARAETLATKFPFKFPLKAKQTCLIPANSFYEWEQVTPKTKQPWCIRVKDTDLFTFAGLWEEHVSGKLTCTIVTVEANELIRPVHPKNRMAVILDEPTWDAWLNDADMTVLQTYPADRMYRYKVGPYVSGRSKGPECMEPLEPAA